MKYQFSKIVTEEQDLDIKFPVFKARHRKYTYAKFELVYFDHDPSVIDRVDVTICEYGFGINPKIEKRRFTVFKGVLSREFKLFYDEYEHNAVEEEYLNHFTETLNLLK